MSRRISITVDLDLVRGTREAHAVTVRRVAEQIGEFAVSAFEEKGYIVRQAKMNTVMHYVRHEMPKELRRARRILKKVA